MTDYVILVPPSATPPLVPAEHLHSGEKASLLAYKKHAICNSARMSMIEQHTLMPGAKLGLILWRFCYQHAVTTQRHEQGGSAALAANSITRDAGERRHSGAHKTFRGTQRTVYHTFAHLAPRSTYAFAQAATQSHAGGGSPFSTRSTTINAVRVTPPRPSQRAVSVPHHKVAHHISAPYRITPFVPHRCAYSATACRKVPLLPY